MSDTFDLEQQLMDCWHIVDDIKVLEEAVLDKEQSHNDTGNVLIGLEYLYQLKFEKLFATFENHCKEYHQYRKFYELNQAPEIDILDSRIAKGGKETTKDEALKLALESREAAVMAERQRIVNLLMIQHEAAKGTHNYWHVAANLIQADVASDT